MHSGLKELLVRESHELDCLDCWNRCVFRGFHQVVGVQYAYRWYLTRLNGKLLSRRALVQARCTRCSGARIHRHGPSESGRVKNSTIRSTPKEADLPKPSGA